MHHKKKEKIILVSFYVRQDPQRKKKNLVSFLYWARPSKWCTTWLHLGYAFTLGNLTQLGHPWKFYKAKASFWFKSLHKHNSLVENSARIRLKDDEIAKLDGAHIGLGWCYERVELKFHWSKKKTWTQCLFMHVNLTLTRTKLGVQKTSIRPKYTSSNHNETLQFL